MFTLLSKLRRRVETALLENAEAAARLVDISSRLLVARQARAPSHRNGSSYGPHPVIPFKSSSSHPHQS